MGRWCRRRRGGSGLGRGLGVQLVSAQDIKDAERRQARARAKMASEARARVNKSYDDLALKLSKGIDDAVWKQSTPLVRRQLALCMSAATIDSRSNAAVDKFRSLVAGMPPPPDPARVLSDALGAVARTRSAASVDAMCRGEDWLDWGLENDRVRRGSETRPLGSSWKPRWWARARAPLGFPRPGDRRGGSRWR